MPSSWSILQQQARRKRNGGERKQPDVFERVPYLANGDVVVIPDWQAKCAKLTGPITKSNIKDWWHALKECVLQHWLNPEGNYDAVRGLITDAKAGKSSDARDSDEYYKQDKEYRKRKRALERVQQAFEHLVGVKLNKGS